MNYRPEIDGLRALAVLPVVFFHAGIAGFGGGFIGVDVFFVISGFLITSLIARDLRRGEFSILNFWERRARRILPALAAVVIFTPAVGWFLLSPGDYKELGETAIAQSLFSSNIVFWRQLGYFGQTANEVPLLHTWSLAVEEQFYLIFPLSMFLLTRYVVKLRWSLIAISVALSFLVSVWAVDAHPRAAFYLLPTRAWELGAGSLLALWAINSRTVINRKLAEPASVIGLVFILFAVFAYDEATQFPGIAALPPVVGTLLVIWSNTNQKTRSGELLALKPLVGVGLISYSLYLWHWPLIVFWKYPTGSDTISIWATAIIIGTSFLLAYVSWRFIETPFRRRTFLPTRRLMLSGSLGALIVVGGLGMLIRADIGSDLRLPDSAKAYANAEDSRSERQRNCILDSPGDARLSNPDSLCTYGDLESNPMFAVWGDSHVDSLMPALDLLASDFDTTGYHIARSSCPPILGVSTLRTPECNTHNRAVQQLISSHNIGVVVVSASWVAYQAGRDRLTPVQESSFDPSLDEPLVVTTEGLAHTVRKLMTAGIEVWLVRDVPRFEFDPPRRLFGASRLNASMEDIGQDYAEYTRYMAPFDIVFEELEAEGARILDLPGFLCDGSFCPVVKDDIVLYRDSNHLSVEGSGLLAPVLRPIFERLTAVKQPG